MNKRQCLGTRNDSVKIHDNGTRNHDNNNNATVNMPQLSSNHTWGTATVRRFEGEVNVLLRVEANNETRNVDQLLADSGD